ncbi:amino acid ABC transporter permease [Acinetobacter baretiae]|uniref:amino acid ABC transporter permease n=2 Tax=Acinetobacter baretiae TaxID=2605383 RepID=UPI001BB334EC|nr:amino acid ABC transporter permease [Acinetobacter baretiae]
MMHLDWTYMISIIPKILHYLPITLLLAVVSMVAASVLGLALALIRQAKIKVISPIITVYVSLFRSLPSLVLLFLIYFGLPQLVPGLSGLNALTAAMIAFSMKNSAYMAEIFRASLNSVDPSQMEAGLSVGMTKTQVYARIILPQAFLNALPATGNTFISLIKDTSVAFSLGVTEIFAQAKMIAAESFRYFETFVVVGLMYWILVVSYSYFQAYLERKLSRSLQR